MRHEIPAMGTRGEVRWLLAALALHGGLLALLPHAPERAPVATASPGPEAEVDLDLFNAEPPSSPSSARAAEPAAAGRRADSTPALSPFESIGPALTSAARAGVLPPHPSSATAEAAEGVESAPDTSFSFDPTNHAALSADAIGLGGRNVFLGAVPGDGSARPASEAPAQADNVAPGVAQSLRDGLHDRDRALGLGADGPVITAVEELTRPSDAPMNSRAVFQVTTNGDGDVIGVQLVDASQGREQWDKVATALRDAMRGKKLRVPAGTGGVDMTLEVTSRWQLPSGYDPDTEVSVLGVPVKKASPESKKPKRVEIIKPELKVVDAPPPPDANAPMKTPPQQVTMLTILNLAFDPTDLTPRPIRVVHAHVTREVVR
jgi:hypothetical protein